MAQYLDSSGLKIIADELKTAFSQVENNASSKMWNIVANLAANEKVKANTSTGRIYLVGQDDASDGTIESTYKNASVYMESGKMYATSGNINSSETALVTGAVVNTAINTALSSALQYCGTLVSDFNVSVAATKTGKKKGDVYVASAIFKPSKTYINNWKDSSVETGDLFIFDGSKFDIVNGENQVEQIPHTLAWGSDVSIAKIDGTTITVKLPSNPNSVTGITAGTSGTITNSSTTNPYIKIKDDNTYRSQIQLKGGGITSVSSDANGAITISTPGDNWVPQTYTISNLNSITTGKSIWGWINANSTNKPEGITNGGEVLSFTLNNGHTLQFASHYKGNGIYTRNRNADKVNTSEEWSKWKKLAFTEDIPTKLSQFTDDVVAGKYLKSTIYGDYDADTLFNDGFHSGFMSHLPSGRPYGIVHTLSYRGGSNNTKPDFASQIFTPCGDDSTSPNDMFFRTSLADSWNEWNKVITDKNIGNYKSGDSAKLNGYLPSSIYVGVRGSIKSGDDLSVLAPGGYWTGATVNSTNPLPTDYASLSVLGNDYYSSQLCVKHDATRAWIRGTYPTKKEVSNWHEVAFTDSNVASATKLQTPRSIWGQSFDGTNSVTGHLWSDTWRIITDATFDGAFFQSKNYDGTSNAGNIYLTGWDVNTLESFNVKATNSIFSDNVGIGTTSPTQKLDVAGNVKASGDITANKFIGSIRGNITYDNGTDEGHFIGLGSNGVGVKGLLNYVYGNFPILFYTNGFERMRIGEYVGIGTTSPTQKLDVAGNIKANGFIKLGSSDSYMLLGGGGHKSLSDFSKASWKTFTPAETALTNDDVLSTTGEFSLAKGSWDYGGNGYLSAGEFGNIDLAGCSVLTFGGKSGGAYTQLFITAPTTTTPSSKANEILFYNNHGSEYSPGWTRVLTNRNYTEYITDTNYYHTRSYSSGLQISTGTGVSNMYVPYATASQAGVVSTGDQTFAGIKTFNNELKMQGGGTYSTDIATGIACGFKVNRATINDAIIENIYLGAKNGAFKSNTSLNIKKYESISSTVPASTTTLVSINESGDVTAKAFYEESDERLKTFGEDIKVDFDELVKLRKSHFVFNDNPTKQEIGVSAQEVKELYPEIVNTNEDGYLSVDYAKLSVIALKAVDILYNQNKDFERRLKEIEDKLK